MGTECLFVQLRTVAELYICRTPGRGRVPERKQRLRVVDDGRVGETYSNRLISTSFDGGAICITLGVVRLVPEHTGVPGADGEPHVHVTVRLTLSPGTAVDLIKSLNDVLGAARGEQRGPQHGKHAH
jgi:hypothetical protein